MISILSDEHSDIVTSLLTKEKRNIRWSKLAAEYRKLAEEKRRRRELELKQLFQTTALMTQVNQKRATASSSSQLNLRSAHAALSEEDEDKVDDANAEEKDDTDADEDENEEQHPTISHKGPSDAAAFLRERARRFANERSTAAQHEYSRSLSATKGKELWQGAVSKVRSRLHSEYAHNSQTYALISGLKVQLIHTSGSS